MQMVAEQAVGFGGWFVKIRESKEMTQDEVAAQAHINKVTLSRIENNKTGVSKKTAIALAQAVGADVDEACLRADRAPLTAFEPETEQEREVRYLLKTVPAKKRPAVIRAWRAVVETAIAA